MDCRLVFLSIQAHLNVLLAHPNTVLTSWLAEFARTTSRAGARLSTTWKEGEIKWSRMTLNSKIFFNSRIPSQMTFAKLCSKDNQSFLKIISKFGMLSSKVSLLWRLAKMPTSMRERHSPKWKGFLSWGMQNQVVSKVTTSRLKSWIFPLLQFLTQQFQQWPEWSDQNQSSTKRTTTPINPSLLSLKITLKT
jgi:hypothetical protein